MLQFLRRYVDLQLDIVGFLAILGEASVLANAQVSSLSKWSYLPRLLPAPQALIRSTRPERLKPSRGLVVGCQSGGINHQVNHVAHILHDGDRLREYSVRCIKLTKSLNPNPVKATSTGPLTWVSILGCAMSVGLIIVSIVERDGMSLLATVLLSLLSSFIGIGSKWSLELPKRRAKRIVPPGDVVIKYPQGAFDVVKCNEEIARELYFAPEKCIYSVNEQLYRIISLVGTLMLMFGVIALANAKLELQIAYAAAYIFLNTGYWTVAALPQRWHWDLTAYHTEDVEYACGVESDNFTEALWKAIAMTRSTEWAKIGDIAPVSKGWKDWLDKAEEMATSDLGEQRDIKGRVLLPDWDCQKALDEYLHPDAAVKNV
ncbi:hypothetical protein MMC24_002471 [Lignoscripta atroalba]|nr:hypothetical protein [Lignoscripta atroalba]